MNSRGKFSLAAAAACFLALALAGCGGDSSSQTADSTGATSAAGAAKLGATGATGSAKKSSKKQKSSASGSGGSASSGTGTKKKAVSHENKLPAVPDPIKVPASTQQAVRAAFDKNINAILNGNVSYLCGSAYSKAFLAMLDQNGGCESVTSKQVEGMTSYATKITGIAYYPNTHLVAVYANFNFTNGSGPHKSKGGLYFKKEDGSWKRAVPPKA